MRPFEISLFLLVIVFIIYLSIRKKSKSKNIEIIGFSLIILLHFILESYRWQMIPLYFLSFIILISIYKNYRLLNGKLFVKLFKTVSILLILLIGYYLPTALPIFELPKTNGKYFVGSSYIHLKTKREETITKNANDKRELMIKVWYPASLNNEKKENYLNSGDRLGFTKKYGLPHTTLNYLDAIETNTFKEPEIVKSKFPVLIFSHGSYSQANGYYSLIENIVSHGYIVLGVNHTYESVGSLFPNDSIFFFDKEYDARTVSTKEMTTLAWESQQNFNNATTENEKLKVSEKILTKYVAVSITERWSRDISSLINELNNWNDKTFLKGSLDVNKIGIFGHSQGGSAAGQALLTDERILSGINIDGVQWGNMINSHLTKPFLLLSSDWSDNHPNFNKYAFRNKSSSVFFKAIIKNSGHSNFMDIPLMINIPFINESGTIEPKEAYDITNELILNFFDNTLKNKQNNILDLQHKFNSLEIKIMD